MYPIYPIKEESCRSFYGMPVMVMMQDGSGQFGILGGISGGKLYLNGEPDAATGKTGLHSRRKARNAGSKAQAGTSAASTRRTRKAGTNTAGGGQASDMESANPEAFFAPGTGMLPGPELPFPGTGKRIVLDISGISGLFLALS